MSCIIEQDEGKNRPLIYLYGWRVSTGADRALHNIIFSVSSVLSVVKWQFINPGSE